MARTTKKNTKEQKEKNRNLAPDVLKMAKEPKEKGENPVPDVNVDVYTLAATKKAC